MSAAISAANPRLMANSIVPSSVSSVSTATLPPSKLMASIPSNLGGAVSDNRGMTASRPDYTKPTALLATALMLAGLTAALTLTTGKSDTPAKTNQRKDAA